MTSRATETEQLIADIDRLLTNKRLPRLFSNQGSELRQVLERIRDFLVNLSESYPQVQTSQERESQQFLPPAKSVAQDHHQSLPQQQSLQQQENINFLVGQESNPFAAVLAPLQEEIKALLQERSNLVEEIRQLEQKRLHNYSLAQQLANQEQIISEFLQVLKSRIVSDFTPQTTETAANSQMQHLVIDYQGNTESPTSSTLPFGVRQSLMGKPTPDPYGGKPPAGLAPQDRAGSPVVESPDQVERLSRLGNKLDQKLLALDGTVNVVFEALQGNIHTYHESLSEALARMHSKGVQGEQLLASLISNFTQQLQQQTSINQPSVENVKDETPQLVESNDLVSELPEVIPNNQTLNLEAQQESGNTSENAVVFQDSQDGQNSLETPHPSTLHQNSSQFIRDQVDQLYASLFGADVTDVATNKVTDITDEFFDEPATTVSTPSEVTTITDELSTFTLSELTDELFEQTITTPAEAQVTNVTDVTKKLSAPDIDQFFQEQTASTPTVITNDDTTVTNVITTQETNVIDELFDQPTLSSSDDASPPTVTHQPQSEFLYEITFDAPQVPTKAVTSETSEDAATNQQLDSIVEIPDPWLEELEADLVKLSPDDAKQQDVGLETTEQSSIPQENILPELPPVEDLDNTSPVSPTIENIITVLTDLLADTNRDQSLATTTAPVTSEAVETPPQNVTELIAADVIENADGEESSENKVPALPQENVLFLTENQSTESVDISLEEAQLDQLEQDLASFDGEINALLHPLTQSENQENPETEPNSSTIEPQAELEKSVVTEEINASSVPISGSTNNDAPKSIWYLGIDLGTTGISAALLNRSTTEVYPLYWSAAQTQEEPTSTKRSFRLPSEVYLPTASVTSGETETLHPDQTTAPAVGEEKVPENMATSSPPPQSAAATQNLFSAQLKPYLQIALPYKSEGQKWEPVLQLNEFSTVPLVWVVRSLSKLLLTFMEDRSSTTLGLSAAAVGLEQETFCGIIKQITGVICTCPSNWSEQYRFNIREAILISKLVQHPQQVFFLEEGIACLLSELDGAEGEIVKITDHEGTRSAKSSDRPLVGNTFVLNIGAAATEMALVNLPENLEDLTHSDFMLHGFAYAGKQLEQDIICQLLLPSKWRQPRTTSQEDTKSITTNSKNWQPAIPGLDQMSFSSLNLEELNLPQAGEPDVAERIRLQQRLESSLLGKAIIDAAIALKLILQHQESFTLELADQQWVLQRRDLESQVFVPFVRRLNREINRLLVAKGIPTEAINQAIFTGGVASVAAVSRWLRQKLPNAKIIQDLYLGENNSPNCSRVAYGLALLPLHPQVLEVPRQQYTDYFLFTELLRILPLRAISFGEVIQLFENRGINTRSCEQRLMAFLEGELPSGLNPTSTDAIWLTQGSCDNSNYKAITAAPLFEKQGSLTYRPNTEQLQTVTRYLNAIKPSFQQSLEEPYTVNFALGIVD